MSCGEFSDDCFVARASDASPEGCVYTVYTMALPGKWGQRKNRGQRQVFSENLSLTPIFYLTSFLTGGCAMMYA